MFYSLYFVVFQLCRIVDDDEVEVGINEVEVSGELRVKVRNILISIKKNITILRFDLL